MNEPVSARTPQASTPLTEEQILAATIGERKPHNSTIYLAPYDPQWPTHFAQLKSLIRGALGEEVLLLEHVGSTSVLGLSAKPVIDMVLAVADSSDEAAYVPRLEAAGFTLRIRESDWYEHRLLKAPGIKGNLHVFSEGCEEIDRMLFFRDWLRAHPEDRERYDQEKRKLAARTWKYRQNYADAKTTIIHEILARARAE
jgi:GrpB-like predicted nucleotidyltransferase (UPF0157 family)